LEIFRGEPTIKIKTTGDLGALLRDCRRALGWALKVSISEEHGGSLTRSASGNSPFHYLDADRTQQSAARR